MNGDLMLKLQAWVDGELPGEEARQVEVLVSGNKEAAALASELRMTRGFLRGNELDLMLPEGSDFYWSKIRREIERADAAGQTAASAPAAAGSPLWAALRRFMVPASGMALVMVLAVLSGKYFAPSTFESQIDQMVEVENLSEEMSSMDFRSQTGNMFVVVLRSKEQSNPEEEAQFDPLDDLFFQ